MTPSPFLPPPQILHQAPADLGSGPSVPGNQITRRSFIKRTGAASVATVVAMGLGINAANANIPATGSSKPKPKHLHAWEYFFEGEDEFKYWGYRKCKCGARENFVWPKPNVA